MLKSVKITRIMLKFFSSENALLSLKMFDFSLRNSLV